jgi:hypothetical protein
MKFSTQTQAWIHSIAAAFIGAFATAGTGALTLPGVFNLSHDGLINFAKITLAPAIIAVFAVLKQSPLPGSVIQPGDKLNVQNPVIQDGVITGDTAQLQKAIPKENA